MEKTGGNDEIIIKNLMHVNSLYRAMLQVNQLIIRESDPEVIISEACRYLSEVESFAAAWVLLTDGGGKVSSAFQHGLDSGLFDRFVENLKREGTLPDCLKKHGASKPVIVIKEKDPGCRICLLNSLPGDNGAFSTEISYRDRVYGRFTVAVDRSYVDSEEDHILLMETAKDLGFSLHVVETEKRAREHAMRFRTLFDFIPDAVFLFSLDDEGHGKFLEINDTACKRYGYTREEFLELGPSSISNVSAEIRKKRLEALNALRDNQPLIFETEHKRKDGSVFPVEMNSSLFTSGDRRLIMSVVRDISSRIKIEKVLRESEEKFRLAFHTSQDSMSLSRLEDGIYIDVNQGFTDITGYTREEVIGRSAFDLDIWDNPDDRKRIEKILKNSGKVSNMEVKFRLKGGRPLTALFSADVISFNGVPHFLAVAKDITDVKQVEAEVLKLSQVVKQNPLSIVITSLDGTIEYVNPAFTRITGYSYEEAVGRNPRFLKSGKTPADVYREFWKTISSGKVWEGELVNRKKDGTIFWEKVLLSPVFDSGGRITNYLGVKENITGKKKMEEQLRQTQKMEAVGKLAGGIAHDFNNILTAINGYCDLILRNEDRNSSVYERVRQISLAGDRASSLTKQLLAFSRKQYLDPKEINLNLLIGNLEEMLMRLIGEDIDFRTVYDSSLGNVAADPGQMEQVIMNLVLNSRDAMPEGGELIIETAAMDVSDEYNGWPQALRKGSYARVTVTDTGIGMTKEVMEHIFEPFYTTKEEGEGTGLGLSTVYGILKQSGSSINVYSEPGNGTTVRIYIPVCGGNIKQGAVVDSVRNRDDLRGSETLLIVEDEQLVKELAEEGLKEFGYSILTASNKEEALGLWEDHSGIDLLLTDLIMPGGDGMDLAAELTMKNPGLKILLMSGYSQKKIVRGVNYIQKPFSVMDLAVKVREVLDG